MNEEEHLQDSHVLDDLEDIIIIQMVSLKYYWREVLVISLASAILLNLILYATRTYRRQFRKHLLVCNAIIFPLGFRINCDEI